MATIVRAKLGYFSSSFTKNLATKASNFHKNYKALLHFSSLFYVKGQELKMPALSPTMTNGKIIKWLKEEGDIINPGDVICDIETDKAIVSMEAEEEGILAKILVNENTSNIKVGSIIGLTVSKEENWKNIDIPPEVEFSESNSTSATTVTLSESSASNVVGPPIIPIKMPSVSPTMTAGTIVKWLKKVGDKVTSGDILCDIQTDKAVMSVEAEEDGILAKILLPDDSKDVLVGTVIAAIVPEGEDWKNIVISSTESSIENKNVQSQFISSGTSGIIEVRGKSFGPAVRALLASYQLEPGLIKPTGRNNRLLKEDVMNYIVDNNLEKKPPKVVSALSKPVKSTLVESISSKKVKSGHIGISKYKDIPLSNLKQATAKRLLESKQSIPHSYFMSKCNVDRLCKAKESLLTEGIKVTLNDMLTKATALALQLYPKANANCINNEIKLSDKVDISVAISSGVGCYTPTIKSTNLKNLKIISQEIKELSSKAKSGQLKGEEFEGGTFTISNLGMRGVTHFKGIINPPQCGILAIGGISEILNSDFVPQKQMIINLSYDSRAMQENEAAEFMETLKYFIENPKLLTLDVNNEL